MTFTQIAAALPQNERGKGLLAAFIGCLLISFDPVFIRMSGTSGVDTVFLFGLFTTISMAVIIQTTDPRGLIGAIIGDGWPAALSGAMILGSATCFILSVKYTAVANAMIIMSARPVLTALAAWLILREATRPALWLAMVGVIGGITIVVLGSIQSVNLLGDSLAVATVLFLSLNGAIQRKFKHISRKLIVGLAGLFLAVVMSFFASPATYSANTWLVMAAMGLASAPIGRVLTATSIRYLPAAEAALITLSTSIMATLWVFLLFHEIPTTQTLIGGAVVLTTIVVYIRYTSRNKIA